MVLGKSIFLTSGRLLLGAGYRINNMIISKLMSRGYSHVYIMEEGTENILPEDVISDEIRMQAKSGLAEKVSEISTSLKFKNLTREKMSDLLEKGYLNQFNIAFDLRQIAKEIINDITASGSTFMSTLMIKSTDTFFLDHAVNTAVLATLIGVKYRFSRKELTTIALGSLLHDIGKIVIEQIKDKNIADPATAYYKEHPTFGYILLKDAPELSPMETQIVNQHHEMQDGSGFPIGLEGRNHSPIFKSSRATRGIIYRFAEITCVANVFDNLVANPVKGDSCTPEKALAKMVIDSGSKYNKDIIETLHKVIPMFPVGTRVEIVDIVDPSLLKSFGFVVRINKNKLNRPVIIISTDKRGKKIKPILLDTSKLNRIELKLIL